MGFELANWVKDGKYRIQTLKSLIIQPLLSSELANKLNISRSSMSRILKVLKDKRLVTRILSKSRTVTYKITPKGLELLKMLEMEVK